LAAPAVVVLTQPAGRAGAVTPFEVLLEGDVLGAEGKGVSDITKIGGAILELDGGGDGAAAGAAGGEGEVAADRWAAGHDDAVGLRAARAVTPPVAARCRPGWRCGPAGVLPRRSLTVRSHPDQATPLAGVQLSATRVAPALVITGLERRRRLNRLEGHDDSDSGVALSPCRFNIYR